METPESLRELLTQAVGQPAASPPGSTPPASPDHVRQQILRAFLSRGIGHTTLGPYRPRASSAGGCVRALTYHRRGIPDTDPPPPEVGLTLELGTLLHLYLDAILVHYGLPIEIYEHPIRVPYRYGEITGHFDRSLGGTTIVDYKSASRASFDLMVERDEPLPQHRAQITFYLHGARLAGLPYTHGLIVAYCKDPGAGRQRTPWVSPPLPYDPDLAAQTIRMFETVEQHARAGTLPPRPYTAQDEYPCRSCRWRRACWEGAPLGEHSSIDIREYEEIAARYVALTQQIRELERESQRCGGRLKAALADAGATRGHAGDYEISLSRYERTTVDSTLVPPDILARAARTTLITTLTVARRQDGDPEISPATPPVPSPPLPDRM